MLVFLLVVVDDDLVDGMSSFLLSAIGVLMLILYLPFILEFTVMSNDAID